MAKKPAVRIIGTGRAVPESVLTNADLERMVDTSDEWITTRTGIKERRIVKRGEKTSDYCIRAARLALEDAQVSPEELDFIIIATISGDMRFPATAVYVQGALRANNATCWDISATCSGFLFGLYNGELLISAGRARKGLVIGVEMLSTITNWDDRGTCVLFGDGAGAVVLAESTDERGILSTYIGTSGDQTHLLYCYGRGTAGAGNNGAKTVNDVIFMNGNEVFRHAVRTMGKAAVETLARAGITSDQVDWLIPHQANIRIIQATAERLNLPMDKVYVNINRYGNTSSASVPIALDEARRNGILKDGQLMVSVVFGGGFTWGGAAVQF